VTEANSSAFSSRSATGAGFHYGDPATARVTLAQRDLMLTRDHAIMKKEGTLIRLAVELGADQAVADGARSLEAVYPYQSQSVAALNLGGGLTSSMFGATFNLDYKSLDSSGAAKSQTHTT